MFELNAEEDAGAVEEGGPAPQTRLLGLDGEMSSADLATGGRLIQAGFAIRLDGQLRVFTTLIGWDDWPEGSWSPRAAQVHGLTQDDLADAPRAQQADEACEAWLLANGATEGRRALVSVGFNVVAFDHPFFRATLPRTMALVSRRALDLNAACFTFDGWDPRVPEHARDWLGWKRSLKAFADRQLTELGVPGRPHDAGWDAGQALLGLEWLQAQLAPARAPDRKAPLPGQDPRYAQVLGAGLLNRLAGLDPVDLAALVDSVEVACAASQVTAGVLLGRRRPELGGQSLLDLVGEGRVGEVLTFLTAQAH